MKIPFDPSIAKEMKADIDPTNFGVVKSYFRDSSSEINQVMLVQEDFLLEDVAAFVVGASEEEAREVLPQMFESGVIKMGVDDFRWVHAKYEESATLLDSIPDDQMCYVIYLPPYYIVKLTKKKWR